MSGKCILKINTKINANSKLEFSGKVVIITGSSSGIGAVTAQEFAREGAQVVINGRNVEKLAEVGELCLKASPTGLKPLEVVGDVSNEEDCKRLIDSTIEGFGRLDVLVNNAGAGAGSSLDESNYLETFDKMIRINLRSVVYLTHLSAKHLEKTKGNIVNISSGGALKPFPSFAAYGMSKAALDYFTECCALELGPKGIRVNVINPGHVYTNFMSAMGVDNETKDKMFEENLKSLYPIGRYGVPKDISNYILFLASDKCSWVTGINFVGDGGLINAPMPSS